MEIVFSPTAKKQKEKLPKMILKKFYKQSSFLLVNPFHPSLRARKMVDGERFEARIDISYRFTYTTEGDRVWILSIGQHDKGLGKK